MAEQLNKNDYINHPDKIGMLNYYSLGETTVKQLQKNVIISSKTKKFLSKRPDALVTDDHKNVLVFIENKDIGALDTEESIQKAIDQELEVAKALKAPIYVVTDTKKSYWLNTLTGERILNENGEELRTVFKPNENKKQLEKLIKKIVSSIDKQNNQIKEIVYLDPSDLATAVHQKIWIAKNSSPETCLYTFVEIFIFKYLSDLGVLNGDYSFDALCRKYEDEDNSDEYVLDFYLGATGPREKIKSLFPAGEDGTTVVNGDIFHVVRDRDGEYVKNGDGATFKNIIEEFKKYEEKFGKFLNVDKDFKSKLFESFLKNEKDKQKMGQFFTPLKVVEQMNRMIEIKEGMKICDPACGVGKFLLEAIEPEIENLYKFKVTRENGRDIVSLDSKVEIYGFDKYSEDNSDRTIILAKANMLIYFSKLITENPSPTYTRTLANELFNKSFIMKKSNLGSLEDLEEDKYDVILTNPPYVVNGSADIKNAAKDTKQYTWNGLGLEALFMEWIGKSLRENGTALIVVPDGIFSNLTNKTLRTAILKMCKIEAIISLPINTFFGTPKKTYILALKKKVTDELGDTKKQETPVFTYICNSIGETLDIYRFDTDENDLEQAVNQYKLYQATNEKDKFKAILYDENEVPFYDKKMKLVPIEYFYTNVGKDWIVDNLWSDEEKIELGFKKQSNVLSVDDLQSLIDVIVEDMSTYKEDLKCLM
ncbi:MULTISPECIES: class I SAM-dependent DNA methyltransferase [unclassified Lysinibacillus]|uniref:HsdM family class I SAM-dependent methyltransferase n=1 Tax=unclassified Lysinibacillus TaxID=2636778 RepID=UPI00382A62CA